MKTLTEIKTEVDRMAGMIGVSDHDSLPTYGYTRDAAYPHIEVDDRGYHFVVVERGKEWSRLTSVDLDDLLYWIFQSVTFDLATRFELAHRIEGQDSRRIWFQRQIELLAQLSVEWGEHRRQDQERILRDHPFDDLSSIRATFTRELRENGHSAAAADQIGLEHYPKPTKSE